MEGRKFGCLLVDNHLGVWMLGGDDIVTASTANDLVYGNEGEDIIIGDLGNDSLYRFVILQN